MSSFIKFYARKITDLLNYCNKCGKVMNQNERFHKIRNYIYNSSISDLCIYTKNHALLLSVTKNYAEVMRDQIVIIFNSITFSLL